MTRPPEDTSTGAVPLQAAKQSGPGNRQMSRTSPITAAATAGPTPDTSVTVVPEAWTAAASRRLVSRRRASRRRRPARNSPASSRRAAWTAPAGWICSRRRAAAAARICLLTPPGTSSHSTACSRHTTWLRDRLRSRCRLARPVSTAAWSSARTGGQAADRSAATATERASSGSFLFTSPASFEPRHGKGPTGGHIVIKPDHTGRQAVREPAHRAPSTLRTTPQRIQKQLDDMHRAGLS